MTLTQIVRRNVRIPRTLFRESRAQVLLVSYPKSGRTWLRAMVGKVLCTMADAPDSEVMRTYELTTRLGLAPTEATHDGSAIEDGLHWRQLRADKRKYDGKRVIFVSRDVRDVLVSGYFHATRRARVYSGSIADFVRHERYGARKILTFNRAWYESRQRPREMVVARYEDLHRDAEGTLRTALGVMGVPADADTIARALEFGAFDRMQKLEASGTIPQGIMRPGRIDDPESFKVRRGVVGGYRDYLSTDDIAYVDGLVAEIGQPFHA